MQVLVGAYPGFCSMKQLGVLLTPFWWDACPWQSLARIKLAGTQLYIWVERSGTVRVMCLAHEHNTMSPVRAQMQTA